MSRLLALLIFSVQQPTVLITVDIHPEQNIVSVFADGQHHCTQAILLSAGGEEVEHCQLIAGYNQLRFFNHPPGTYSLRIECENEVVVRQFTLPHNH